MENPSPEVAKVAATAKRSDVKDFAKTKHKGLPMKKKVEEANKSGDNSLVTGLARVSLLMASLVGCNLAANMQENPVQNNQDKQLNPSAGLVKMKRNLNKDEEEAAFRRKNRKKIPTLIVQVRQST